MFALGVFALLPGGSNNPVKPGIAEAAFDCTTTHRIRVIIRNDDTGANLTLGGSRVRISPDPQNATGGGTRTYVDNGSNDPNPAAGVIDEPDACRATESSSYTLTLLEVPQGCSIVGSGVETLQDVTANRQVTFHVEDCDLTPTPTPTTTATVTPTPTATSTPAAPSQATVSAAPTSLNCNGSSFITAVFRDAAGNPVPNGTQVTITANIGSVSPSTASTNGGSVLVLYTAPATSGGTATITATAGGVSGTATITVNCVQATNTPVPPTPTSPPAGGVIVPPATGDGGLAAGGPARLYGGIALIALSLLGALAVLRPRRA